MSAPLTHEQALQILDLFGGQYPFNDVSGYLLALEALGLVDPSTEGNATALDAPVDATAGVVAPSGQASDTPAPSAVSSDPSPAPAVHPDGSPVATAETPAAAPVEAPVATTDTTTTTTPAA